MADDKKPWEGETAPDEELTPAQKGAATKAAKAAAELEQSNDNEQPVDTKQLALNTQIVMGKLAEKGVDSDTLHERSIAAEIDDADPSAILAFLEEQLELTKPIVADAQEQAPLALLNLVSQGVSMQDAKKKLGIK